MDSVGNTANTFFEVPILYQSENWFSVRARGDSGLVGRRAIAIKQDAGMLMNCAGVAPTADFVVDTVVCESKTAFLQDLSLKSPDSWQWTISPSTGVSFEQGSSPSSASPIISFADTGSYELTLKVTSQFGVDSTVKTVHILPCNVSIADGFDAVQLKLYPNPNAGAFRLLMEGALSPSYQIELLDLAGRIHAQREIKPIGDRVVERFVLGELPKGLYLMRVKDGERTVVLKVVLR